ncbi:MAG: NAD(P)-binding domain-containing protein, partial [Rhodospirillaceae bacterium]|nr:NAD(P)-binding domain-containing protein [Rhodospirillaceae bacterium]
MINQDQKNLSNQKVGVIGLGLMGTPMCQQMYNSGIDLYIWNRNSQRSRKLSEKLKPVTVCKTPAEVALNCDIIITMVTDATAVEAIVFGKSGIAEGCRDNSLLIDMGTTSVIQTRNFSERLSKMGGNWVDAPVSGGTTAAENGSLT